MVWRGVSEEEARRLAHEGGGAEDSKTGSQDHVALGHVAVIDRLPGLGGDAELVDGAPLPVLEGGHASLLLDLQTAGLEKGAVQHLQNKAKVMKKAKKEAMETHLSEKRSQMKSIEFAFLRAKCFCFAVEQWKQAAADSYGGGWVKEKLHNILKNCFKIKNGIKIAFKKS